MSLLYFIRELSGKITEEQGAYIIILPSSIHETLLILERDETSYENLGAMVADMNQSEVLEEDHLSNKIYKYSHMSGKMESVFQTGKCLINRKLEKIPLGNCFCKGEFYFPLPWIIRKPIR